MTPRNVITLDLWLTLVTGESSGTGAASRRDRIRLAAVAAALAEAGETVPEGKLDAAFERARADIDHAHNNGADRTFPLWVRQVIDYAAPGLFDGLPDEAAESVIAAVDRPFIEAPPTAHAAASDVLAVLAGSGLRLALISNIGFTSGDTYRQWLDGLGWLDRFEVTTFSSEAGVAKPAAAIFTGTLDEMGVRPGDALHVGDNLLADVMGAHAAGMSTAWISGFDQRAAAVAPDFTLGDLAELPAVVKRWRAG